MPFGLTNAPTTFQHEMNDIFREQLGKFVFIFLDDILLYSRTLEEHAKHVCFVLQTLRDKQFYAKISKSDFFKKSITFIESSLFLLLSHHLADSVGCCGLDEVYVAYLRHSTRYCQLSIIAV